MKGIHLEQLMSHYITRTAVATVAKYDPCSFKICSVINFVPGKDFKSSETLRMHEQIHQDKATHKCNFCDKTFKQQPSLYTHMKTHTRMNMYKCQMCSKEFITKYRLKNHLMRHNGERPSKLITQC